MIKRVTVNSTNNPIKAVDCEFNKIYKLADDEFDYLFVRTKYRNLVTDLDNEHCFFIRFSTDDNTIVNVTTISHHRLFLEVKDEKIIISNEYIEDD